jgi:hypothetical protein
MGNSTFGRGHGATSRASQPRRVARRKGGRTGPWLLGFTGAQPRETRCHVAMLAHSFFPPQPRSAGSTFASPAVTTREGWELLLSHQRRGSFGHQPDFSWSRTIIRRRHRGPDEPEGVAADVGPDPIRARPAVAAGATLRPCHAVRPVSVPRRRATPPVAFRSRALPGITRSDRL